jgi:hypothetical protein
MCGAWLQAAICDSLQHYNKQIDELKREMDEATDIAGGCQKSRQCCWFPERAVRVLASLCSNLSRMPDR